MRRIRLGLDGAGIFEVKMKRFFLLIFFALISSFTFGRSGHGITLTDHGRIKVLSSFKILDQIDLYNEYTRYTTLNHEGGTEVRVLEILKRDVQDGESGMWMYVLLVSPMWVESGEWLDRYEKFLIFLPDSVPVFDYEE